MKSKILFFLAVAGIVAGLVSAYYFRAEKKPMPPIFNPAPNPYAEGIYCNGIIESYQSSGANINIFPEVSGTITQIHAVEGATVRKGAVLLEIDDAVQSAVVEQQKAQAEAALVDLRQLEAQPRKETLEVAKAQVEYAAARLEAARSHYEKLKKTHQMEARSVSRDQLDTAEHEVATAAANLEVARKQFELTRAGAWTYDIQSRQRQYEALAKAYAGSKAVLDRYTVTAPVDGVILAVNAAPGGFVSPQGAYGTYTGGFAPVIVMAASGPYLGVRCYIDEILIAKLPAPEQMKAKMFFRGSDTAIPLEFERVQPYVVPKIQLSNQRTERVDVRVLPVLFRFAPPAGMNVYPGQLVDVYLEAK